VADGTSRRRTDDTQADQNQATAADRRGSREEGEEGSHQGQTTAAAEFFRAPKYLTVSSQLHLEALAHAVGNVWALAPVFRAERSDTARHLSEFYMLEAEASFTDGLEPVMALLEALLAHLAADLLRSRLGSELLLAKRNGEGRCEDDDNNKEEVGKVDGGAPSPTPEQLLRARWRGLERRPWPRITYSDAISRLKAAAAARAVNFEHAPCWGSGLQVEHEMFLANTVGAGRPVFVTDYPRSIKAFYMAPSSTAQQHQQHQQLEHKQGEEQRQNDDLAAAAPPLPPQPLVACFDLLVPGMGEIAGGSLREHRLEPLVQSMREHGLVTQAAAEALRLSPSSAAIIGQQQSLSSTSSSSLPAAQQPAAHSLQWYVDLRRWGSVPHGGFGLGFDRLLAYLAGVSNVREVVAFPRWAGRCLC
jgi:asparaginyl-tRNA synthetase